MDVTFENLNIRHKGFFFETLFLFLGLWIISLFMVSDRGVNMVNDFSKTKAISVITILLHSFLSFMAFGLDSVWLIILVLLATLPTILGSITMLLYRNTQKGYYIEVVRFIDFINQYKSFSFDYAITQFPKTDNLSLLSCTSLPKYILEDLKENNLIGYVDDGKIVDITFINPIIAEDATEVASKVVKEDWECPNCGAYNNGRLLSCEYCATTRPSK